MPDPADLSEYHELVRLRDGSEVMLRPIRPDDAPRLQQAFTLLSPETIYMRFLEAAKELSAEQARSLAEVDYHERMALVATIQEAGEERLVGVARYGMIPDRPGLAEAAVVVRDDYQHRGIGKQMMQRLVDYARRHSVQAFIANVNTANFRIIHFIRSSGLPIERKMLEPGMWEIRIQLTDEISNSNSNSH